MRDDAVRRFETWTGYLTKATINDVRLRIKETFCAGQLVTVVTTDDYWRNDNWPEVTTGVTLSDPIAGPRPDHVPSKHSPLILTVSSPRWMHMWATYAEDQIDVVNNVGTPCMRFTHDTLMIRSYSPSGHQIYHIFTAT